jgi:hypothetical protein
VDIQPSIFSPRQSWVLCGNKQTPFIMKKLRLLLTLGLLGTLLLFNACSKDEDPAMQFVVGDVKYSLKGNKLYLTSEGNYVGTTTFSYRDYMITDGTLIEGENGWSLSDYTNATYYLAIEISTPNTNTLGPDEFPQHSNWSLVPATSNMGYLYLESGEGNDNVEIYTNDENEDLSPVVVTGGLDDGEKMTFQFNGTLSYYRYDGVNWVETSEDAKLFFRGTVIDARP